VRANLRFLFSCSHILNQYACLEKNGVSKIPPHMHPDHQVQFCVLGLDKSDEFNA